MPTVGVTSHGETCSPPPRTLLPVPGSYGLMRQTLLALPSFGYSPRSESLCRLLPAPAASGFFPTLSLQIFPQMPGPLPRRSHRVLVPVSSPMSSAFPKTLWVGFPFYSANATFRGLVSRLQTFRYVQASEFARLPDRSYRCEFSPQGSRDFYLRAYRALSPPHAPDMLSVRYRQLTEKRTFTFPDLQPCRLLQCLSQLILFAEASLRRAVTQFIQHYHLERPHQGKANQLLFPAPGSLLPRHAGRIKCHERLGGLLKFYQRAA